MQALGDLLAGHTASQRPRGEHGAGLVVQNLRGQMSHIAAADMSGYVLWADRMGGRDSPHLVQWCDGVNSFVSPDRSISGQLLKTIGELSSDRPVIKRCLATAALQCPSSKVKPDGQVHWITGTLWIIILLNY